MGGRALIVLDTHAAVWYANGIKLRAAAAAAIGAAIADSGVAISSISAWEIGMLVSKKRLIVAVDAGQYVRALFTADGVIEEVVSAEIAILASMLPGAFHGDPADRIIVATAVHLGSPLVTRDARIISYLRKSKLTPVLVC